MPTFPQFVLESFLAFGLLLGFYRMTLPAGMSFTAQRWQLRLIPVVAYLLPLLHSISNLAETLPNGSKMAMSLGGILDFKFPDFSVQVGTVMMAFYFVGVVVMAFRLVDRLWQVSHFLKSKENAASLARHWQGTATASMSHLVLQWDGMSEAEKKSWATKWLPVSLLFGWEALLVELFLVFNWWNPLAHRYRECWSQLLDHPPLQQGARRGFFASNLPGFASLILVVAILLAVVPPAFSPTHRLGLLAGSVVGKTILENKIARPHHYVMAWGNAKMPLKKFANPNGFSVDLEMELHDFQEIIKQELQIYRDGERLKAGTLSIIYKSTATGNQVYINGIDPKKIQLLDRKNGLVYNDSLRVGDNLVLFGDVGDIYLSKVEIRIKDPNAGYEPPYFVPQINHLAATMAYQIIARHGKRALVKIDPDHPNSLRILQLYSDARQYEIVRIPGFRTNRHYLTEAESLASIVAAATTTLTHLEPDAFYLPEYQNYQNQDVRMIWGEMVAAPTNDNYALDSFLLSIGREPQLLVGEDTLTLVSFEVVVAGKNRPAKSYSTYRTRDFAVYDVLVNVEDETSIFFEKIVVRDQDGNPKLFPASFAFNIGNPKNAKDRKFPSNKDLLIVGEKNGVIGTHEADLPKAAPLKKGAKRQPKE